MTRDDGVRVCDRCRHPNPTLLDVRIWVPHEVNWYRGDHTPFDEGLREYCTSCAAFERR